MPLEKNRCCNTIRPTDGTFALLFDEIEGLVDIFRVFDGCKRVDCLVHASTSIPYGKGSRVQGSGGTKLNSPDVLVQVGQVGGYGRRHIQHASCMSTVSLYYLPASYHCRVGDIELASLKPDVPVIQYV